MPRKLWPVMQCCRRCEGGGGGGGGGSGGGGGGVGVGGGDDRSDLLRFASVACFTQIHQLCNRSVTNTITTGTDGGSGGFAP